MILFCKMLIYCPTNDLRVLKMTVFSIITASHISKVNKRERDALPGRRVFTFFKEERDVRSGQVRNMSVMSGRC